MASNLTQRVVTSLLAAPVAVALVWLGGWAFALLIVAIALASQAEVYGLLRTAGTKPLAGLGLALGAVAVLRTLIPFADAVLVVGAVAVLAVALFVRKEGVLLDAAGTLFGVFYPAYLLGFGIALRAADGPGLGPAGGFWLTAAVMVSVWGADTLAYTAGRLFGKHPLFPRVSPKKTWEGALGGLLGAFLVVAAFKLAVLDVLGWGDVVALALCAGVAGPLGDLIESQFKRDVGVKDSGTWIPGHGGMLDRLDAMAVTVPLATLYLALVAGLV